MYYRVGFPGQPWRTSSCDRPPTTSCPSAERLDRVARRCPRVPGRGALPPRAQLLAWDRSVRQHSAGHRGGPDRGHSAAQSTRQEIFDFLVSELTAIQADLPATAGQGTYGRATKEAAAMLLAHVYLNAEVYTGTPQYAQALAAAQAVIAGPFTLDPSYRHIFQADNQHLARDHLPGDPGRAAAPRPRAASTFLIHASCGGSMDPGDPGVDGCWWGLRLKPEAYNRSAPGDPRGVVLLDRRPDRRRRQHQQLHGRRGRPEVPNMTSAGADGSDADLRGHRLPDVPARRCLSDLRRGPPPGRRRRTGRRPWPT